MNENHDEHIFAPFSPGCRMVATGRQRSFDAAFESGIETSAVSTQGEDPRLPPGSGAPLPEFDRPPVTEVALSVQFAPIEAWRAVHAGLYWGLVKEDYPLNETHPPFPPVIEKFDSVMPLQPPITVSIGDADMARFWFLSADKTRLIQIQRDRFVMNWRKITGEEIYPRYNAEIRPKFLREWEIFNKFLRNQTLGDLVIQQFEIAYINDIPRGEGWNTLSDALTLFSPWWGKGTDGWLQTPETVIVQGSFRLPEDQGRLHFATQNLIRNRDQIEVVQLRLVCRGKASATDADHIAGRMDLGREWVVRAFADLTSPTAHVFWGRVR